MPQAKGVLPRRDDREVLYKNPQTCGYFIGVALDPAIDRARAEAWLSEVQTLIDALVERLAPEDDGEKGRKVASVAVGFAPGFFHAAGQPRFDPSIEPPASFVPGAPLPSQGAALSGVPVLPADVLFYVASVFEARVNAFISQLASMRPDVQAISLDRGYQRLDDTEPFGYLDGVRNVVPADRRPAVTFVHAEDRDVDEPAWADGGTYMAFMRIAQNFKAFADLPDDATRDAIIGRTKDGRRLDVDAGTDPRNESNDPGASLPPNSHVRKAGPRGSHDDLQIFRRGLPFMEIADGQLKVGLNFCSFQASLDQFDVVFNSWMMERRFPPQPNAAEVGADALMDPARGLTSIEKVGFYFVPPHHPDGLAAAVHAPPGRGRPTTGRLMVRKRVEDLSDPSRRFELSGFGFQVTDAQNNPVGEAFETDSTGRAVCPVELTIGETYTLNELPPPIPNIEPQSSPFTMEKPNQQLPVTNKVTVPNTPYGA